MKKWPVSSAEPSPWAGVPDERRRFGTLGGQFVPEALMPGVVEPAAAHDQAVALEVER